MAVLVLMMMAATVIEKISGTPAAFRLVYHNPLFIGLWSVAAISVIISIWSNRRSIPFFTKALHLSCILILVGAMVTFLFGKKGNVHLYLDEPESEWNCTDGQTRVFPFVLTLKDFHVEYYRGSMAPSDYESRLTVDGEPVTVSMNKILRRDGYRLYQTSFDRDMKGSLLTVSYDPWGVGITYAGYLLLLLSMIGFFFQKDTAFKAVLRRVAAASAVAALFVVSEAGVSAKTVVDTPKVLPEEVAGQFGDLYVYYNDRIAPVQTMARDYCLKVYGKSHWKDYTAEQVFTGWLFYYDWWRVVPYKIKAKDKGTPAEGEKEFLVRSVASGDALRLFPLADSAGVVSWYGCNDTLPAEVLDNYELWVFIRKVMDVVNESVRAEDWDEVSRLLGRIKAYQEKTAMAVLPSADKVRAEKFYNRISRPMVPFMASVTLGMILFVLSGIWISKGRKTPKGLQHVLAVISGLLFIYLTAVLGLRWYVSGHAPFAGSYSVMMLMAWMSALFMTIVYRKFPLAQPLGFLLAGFTMLMASMASANPQITHLMPVLQSPLLSIHVLAMMISYTLFGLIALNGIMGLVVPAGEPKDRLRDISLVILYPALFLLTFGTFLGAVWANISWGSYWQWDPKETWALVTILVYLSALHGIYRSSRAFHLFCIFAFLSVLITYFGVNVILGGMHSYA